MSFQLSPIERYAMRLVEESEAPVAAEQLAATVAEIEVQKKDWEVQRLKTEEEQQQALEAEQLASSELLTYSSRDSRAQVNNGKRSKRLSSPPSVVMVDGVECIGTNGGDENTPRTRSKGTVKINLWTLDESPIAQKLVKSPVGISPKTPQKSPEVNGVKRKLPKAKPST
jgi:hypothetical protein